MTHERAITILQARLDELWSQKVDKAILMSEAEEESHTSTFEPRKKILKNVASVLFREVKVLDDESSDISNSIDALRDLENANG